MRASNPVDCLVEQRHCVANGAQDRIGRLVELDVVGAGCDEGAQLGVDGRHELRGKLEPVRVVARSLADMDRDRGRAGARRLDPVAGAAGQVAQVREFLDDPEAVRNRDAIHGDVARRAVVALRAQEPQRALRLEAGHPLVEALDELPAPHLAVGDDVDAGLDLVGHGESHRVVIELVEIRRPETAGRHQLEGAIHPAREAVAADDARRQDRERRVIRRRHASSLGARGQPAAVSAPSEASARRRYRKNSHMSAVRPP